MGLSRFGRSRSSADAEARFEALYDQYYGRVLAYVLRRTTSAAAQDVVADTFLVAWRRLDRLSDEPLPWLLGVARKALANQRRTQRRQNAVIDELRAKNQLTGVLEAIDVGEVDAVTKAVNRLSELDRELLKLVVWDGVSTKEAARVVGISHVACRVRLHRTRRRLADELAGGERSTTAGSQGQLQIKEELRP